LSAHTEPIASSSAVAQALVGVIALVGGLGKEAVVLSGFFTAMWLATSGLFRKSGGRAMS